MNITLNLRRLFGSIIWYGYFYFADFWPICQLVIAQFLETAKDFLTLVGITVSFCLIYLPLFLFCRFCVRKVRKVLPFDRIVAVSKSIQNDIKHSWGYIVNTP